MANFVESINNAASQMEMNLRNIFGLDGDSSENIFEHIAN
jgi:hypothetical protein